MNPFGYTHLQGIILYYVYLNDRIAPIFYMFNMCMCVCSRVFLEQCQSIATCMDIASFHVDFFQSVFIITRQFTLHISRSVCVCVMY